MKSSIFSTYWALFLILALIPPPQSALLSPPANSVFPPELGRRTLRSTNAGMEESKVRLLLEGALNSSSAGLGESLTVADLVVRGVTYAEVVKEIQEAYEILPQYPAFHLEKIIQTLDPAQWTFYGQGERDYAIRLSQMNLDELRAQASQFYTTSKGPDAMVDEIIATRESSPPYYGISHYIGNIYNWVSIFEDLNEGRQVDPEHLKRAESSAREVAYLREILYRWDNQPKPRSHSLFSAAGLEEGGVKIGLIDRREFSDTYAKRLKAMDQWDQVIHFLRGRDLSTVELTEITGLTQFTLHTDPGLVDVAEALAKSHPVVGIRFPVSGELRSNAQKPGVIKAPGLIIPDEMMPSFAWPEGSESPVRVTRAVDRDKMAEILPVAWIALSYNPKLTIEQILSQNVLLITLHDDKGTAVLIFA